MAPPNLVNFPKLWEMTISTPTFGPSTPCIIHFECLESGPNDSTRVRRLTGVLRRARVKIFILAYGSFWLQLSEFSSNLTGHHETKLQNGYGAVDQNIQTFISNLGYLWLTRTSWIDSAPSEPSNSSQSGHTGTNVAWVYPWVYPNEHVMKGENGWASNFW